MQFVLQNVIPLFFFNIIILDLFDSIRPTVASTVFLRKYLCVAYSSQFNTPNSLRSYLTQTSHRYLGRLLLDFHLVIVPISWPSALHTFPAYCIITVILLLPTVYDTAYHRDRHCFIVITIFCSFSQRQILPIETLIQLIEYDCGNKSVFRIGTFSPMVVL